MQICCANKKTHPQTKNAHHRHFTPQKYSLTTKKSVKSIESVRKIVGTILEFVKFYV